MLSSLEITILVIVITIGAWWWRVHGQRDYALNYVREHCKNLNLSLLDDYVALKRITIMRDSRRQFRLARIYNFEFTVTGENRYTGTATLFGYHLASIELPPYPFDASESVEVVLEQKPKAPVLYLDKYKRYNKKL